MVVCTYSDCGRHKKLPFHPFSCPSTITPPSLLLVAVVTSREALCQFYHAVRISVKDEDLYSIGINILQILV